MGFEYHYECAKILTAFNRFRELYRTADQHGNVNEIRFQRRIGQD